MDERPSSRAVSLRVVSGPGQQALPVETDPFADIEV
jgi:hypothetical protein